MNRRKFLKIAGGAGVIVAASAAGGAAFLMTRTPTGAMRPWSQAGSLYTDPMRRALSYAILAPNPHNRQPWVVDLRSETEAVLTCDLGRLLPETDPYSRQIVIGLGCFLELFAMAAADQGYRAEIASFPEGMGAARLDGRPVATLRLVRDEGVKREPLFAAVLDRRTNREPYDMAKPVPDAPLKAISTAAGPSVRAGATNDPARVAELRELTRDAMLAEIGDKKAYQESVDLMRIGRAEIEANPDGIALGGPLLDTLHLVGILTRKSVADPNSQSYEIGIERIRESAEASPAYAWIATTGNDRKTQIEAGRAYMRLTLAVQAEGLALQPMSQALQEYAAMAPYYKRIHAMLAPEPGDRLQMLVRLGYGEKQPPAPRWPLDTRIKA